MVDMIPLAHMATGTKARIGQLVGNPEQVQRLEELGLRHGTTIEMLRTGSPCIIRSAQSKLCFRENEALGVLVHVDRTS
jgi:Fe2+ transport system protein FeoA